MDNFFQKLCNFFPHYRLNTKIKKKLFYLIFSLLKLFLNGPFILNFEKFKFYAYPQKKNYSRSLLTKINLHDEGEINLLNKNIDKDSIFIDCGANQGFYTIPIAGHNLETKIYAFEPSPQEMILLKENIKLNNFNNIETLNNAIAEKEGKFNFKDDNLDSHSTKGGFIVDDNQIISTTSVIEATTLNKFVNNLKVSDEKKLFIKIDLEGYDFNAIYGCDEIINKFFVLILFEFSKMGINSKIYKIEEFQNFLRINDLIILDINLNEISLSDLHSKLDKLEKKYDVLGNFLLIKKENKNFLKK